MSGCRSRQGKYVYIFLFSKLCVVSKFASPAGDFRLIVWVGLVVGVPEGHSERPVLAIMELVVPFTVVPVVVPLAFLVSGFLGSFLKEELGDLTPQQLDLALAKALASDEGSAELRKVFALIDRDGNGTVTSQEWGLAIESNGTALRKYFGASMTASAMAAQFARLDVDGSNDLTWDEFVVGAKASGVAIKMADTMVTDKGKREWKQLFDALDKNDDGRVSFSEWSLGLYNHKRMYNKFYENLAPLSNPKLTLALKSTLDEKSVVAASAAEALAIAQAAADGAPGAVAAAEAAAEAAVEAASLADKDQEVKDEALAEAYQKYETSKQELARLKVAEEYHASTPKKGRKARLAAEMKKGQPPPPPPPSPGRIEQEQGEVDRLEKLYKAADKALKSAADKATALYAEKDLKLDQLEKAKAAALSAPGTLASAQAASAAAEHEKEAASEAYTHALNRKEAVAAEIAKAFQRLDVDKNGALSFEELAAGMAVFQSLPMLEA